MIQQVAYLHNHDSPTQRMTTQTMTDRTVMPANTSTATLTQWHNIGGTYTDTSAYKYTVSTVVNELSTVTLMPISKIILVTSLASPFPSAYCFRCY